MIVDHSFFVGGWKGCLVTNPAILLCFCILKLHVSNCPRGLQNKSVFTDVYITVCCPAGIMVERCFSVWWIILILIKHLKNMCQPRICLTLRNLLAIYVKRYVESSRLTGEKRKLVLVIVKHGHWTYREPQRETRNTWIQHSKVVLVTWPMPAFNHRIIESLTLTDTLRQLHFAAILCMPQTCL